MRFRFLAALLAVALMGSRAGAQPENDPHLQAVKAVGMRQLEVTTTQGAGVARYYGTASLDEGSRSATRALITIHGLLRNADVYEKTGEAAIDAAGAGSDTILITPQFLAAIDVSGDALPERTLRWDVQSWLDGSPALGPAPISSFSVLDAILDRLADRAKFPALREIVHGGALGGSASRATLCGRRPRARSLEAPGARAAFRHRESILVSLLFRRPAGGRRRLQAVRRGDVPWVQPLEIRCRRSAAVRHGPGRGAGRCIRAATRHLLARTTRHRSKSSRARQVVPGRSGRPVPARARTFVRRVPTRSPSRRDESRYG
jgi:hypothetical protein